MQLRWRIHQQPGWVQIVKNVKMWCPYTHKKCPTWIRKWKLCPHAEKCQIWTRKWKLCSHTEKCQTWIRKWKLCPPPPPPPKKKKKRVPNLDQKASQNMDLKYNGHTNCFPSKHILKPKQIFLKNGIKNKK